MSKKFRIISAIVSVLMLFQCLGIITFAKAAQDTAVPTLYDVTSSKAYAVSEITSKREENVKHFRMSDGSFAAMSYSVPVHYDNGAGWQDIDNTLASSTDEGANVYNNVSNGIDFKFAKKSNSNYIVKISSGNHKLDFSLGGDVNKNITAIRGGSAEDDGDITTLESITSSVSYSNVLDGVDIEYVLNGNILKENIIVNSKRDEYSFSYDIKAKNLTLSLVDGAIFAKDGDSTVFAMPAPYMYDADGSFSDAVEYTLDGSGKKYTLTVTADKEWVNEASFPVTIDPTVSSGNAQFSMATRGKSSVYYLQDGVTYLNNALRCSTLSPSGLYLRFDLPVLNADMYGDVLPTSYTAFGFKVIGAELNLVAERTVYSGLASSEKPFSVHNVIDNWDSEITFTNKPRYSSVIESYTDFADRDEDYCLISADITDLANKWYSAQTVNYGVYIAPYHSGTPDIGYRVYGYLEDYNPALIVTYISSIGLEDYFTYTTTDTDGMGTAYINNLTGALNYTFTDIASANPRNGMSVYHVYNDEYVNYFHNVFDTSGNQHNVGTGFKLNIQQSVFEIMDPDCLAHLDADGTIHYYFLKDGYDNVYEDELGLGSTITTSDTYGEYVLEYKSGVKYYFDNVYLSAIEDTNGNRITINCTGSESNHRIPQSVTEHLAEGQTRVTTLTWADSGKLAKITGPDGSTAEYTYNGNNLTKVTFDSYEDYLPSGSGNARQSLSFTYDDDGYLASAKNSATRKETTFDRNLSDNTVNYFESIKPAAAEYYVTEMIVTEWVKFRYYPRMTETEDMLSDAYSVSYIFDKYGRTAYVADSEGSSKLYEYSNGDKTRNKVTFESSTKSLSTNILSNGNFSNGFDGWIAEGSYSISDNEVTLSGCLYETFSVTHPRNYAVSIEADAYEPVKVYIRDSDYSVIDSFVIEDTDTFEQHQMYVYLTGGVEYTLEINSMDGESKIRNVQITPGKVAEEYNLVKNGSFFDGLSCWTATDTTSQDSFSQSCLLYGDYEKGKTVSQTINVSGSSFVFGAYVKADTLENKDELFDGSETCTAITLEAIYSDGTSDWKTVMCQNKTGGKYVNLFGYIDLPELCQSVKIYLKNKYNSGTVYFDDVYVYPQKGGNSYTYNQTTGDLVNVAYEDGTSSNATYNSHGDILTSTDAYGKVTSYTYDNKRNVTSVTTPEGVKTNNVYDAYGNVLTSTVSNGINVGAGNATTYTNYGTVVDKVTDPFGTVTKYDVNSTTFTTNAVYSDYTSNVDYLSKTEYNYYNTATVNGLGPLKSVAVKDKNGNTLSSVSYEYSQGELDYIRRGNNYYNFYFSYGDCSYCTISGDSAETISDNGNFEVNNYYDMQGNLVGTAYLRNDANEDNYVKYDYDVVGRLTNKTTLNDTFEYLYNSKGDLVAITKNDGERKAVYDYDNHGKLIGSRVNDSSHSSSVKNNYKYNALDLVTSVTTSVNGDKTVKTDYTYTDDKAVKTQKTYSDRQGYTPLAPDITYKYNPIGMFTGYQKGSLQQYGTYHDIYATVNYKANSSGQLTSHVSSYQYDIIFGSYDYPEQTETESIDFTYQYDDVGNISSVTDHNGKTTSYTYDALNQLTTATAITSTGKTVETFEYNSNGNITGKIKKTYTGEQLTSTDTYQYTYRGTTDQLHTVTKNGTVIRELTQSPISPESNGVYNFTWDGRLLESATRISDNTLIEFEYDSDGKVTYKKVTKPNGDIVKTEFFYSGDKLVQQNIVEPASSGSSINYEYTLQYIYDNSGLSYVTYRSRLYGSSGGSTVTYNVIRNAQGDIVMLVPASATANNYIGAEYDYSAYGEILVSSGTISKHFPFRYRGYYYDADLGMYNLGTRYYDAEIGRFINADGVLSGVGGPIKGYNMFAYCFNNPVNMDDPSGNWPQWLKNCVKWVTKNVFKPAVDFIKDKTKNCNVALSRSQSFNLQIGNYSVGGSIGFSVHTNGDVMVQYDVSSSASTSGGFGISSQSIQGVDFVPTLDLSDYSTDISFNATAPIPNTPISGDGSLTYKQNYSNDGTATYPSISMGVGAAFPSSTKTELGLSMGISKSQKIYEFNIYDKFKKMYIGIMEW